MTNPRQELREAIQSLHRAVEAGDVTEADEAAILALVAAYDEQDMSASLPTGGEYANDTKPKKANSLRCWVVNLHRIATRMDVPLTEATADDVNRLMTAMRQGTHPAVKDAGLSNNTIGNYQGAARRFYWFHEELGVDRDDIPLVRRDETHVDERDMLTADEIDRIRNAAEHPRDLAIFDLLLYTGQRNTAIRSLRIRDIDLDEGVYYLNTDADGLKGADKNGKKRPLLGAVGSLREWLRYHPAPDNPDAYVITGKPRYGYTDPERMVSRNTLNYALHGNGEYGGLKQKAGIDKPMNVHNIRHNFVTICKREYNLDDATIKRLIGHSPDSQVMETTYAHLSDDDYIRNAEEAFGIREPSDDQHSLTPPVCHCGEPLPPTARACQRCGTVYAPDAQAVKQQIEASLWESKGDAEGDEEAAVDQLKQLIANNPSILDYLEDQTD